MAATYSDEEIANFLSEQKLLPQNYRNIFRLRNKRGHKEQELDVVGAKGNLFRIILRQSSFNTLDFSIILAVIPRDSTQLFRLKRLNGKSHQHSNHIEGNIFYDFHIHKATERYQDLGMREDTYAEATDQFFDFNSALNCMLNECGFDLPEEAQQTLFEEI